MSDGAVVLAGGASERMGRDKAWLAATEDAPTLLAHVVAQLGRTVEFVVIVGRPGQLLPPLPLGSSAERIDDDAARAGQGPLVGLAAGLRHLHARGLHRAYLGSVDAPLLTSAHVEWMLGRLGPAVLAAVPDHDGRWHPLAGAVMVEPALAAAEQLLGEGRRSARALFEHLHAVAVSDLPHADALRPCNTPAEWEAARQRLRTAWPR